MYCHSNQSQRPYHNIWQALNMTAMGVIALICQTKMTTVLQNEKKGNLFWRQKFTFVKTKTLCDGRCYYSKCTIKNSKREARANGWKSSSEILFWQNRHRLQDVNFAEVDLYFILNYLGPKTEESTCVIWKKKNVY